MTVQSSIIMRLISQIPDQRLAEQIRDEYYKAVEAQTNFAQVQTMDLAMRIEQKFDDLVSSQFKETNDILEDIKLSTQRLGIELEALRRMTEQGFLDDEQVTLSLSKSIDDIKIDFNARLLVVDEKINDQSRLWLERRDAADKQIKELKLHIKSLRDMLK